MTTLPCLNVHLRLLVRHKRKIMITYICSTDCYTKVYTLCRCISFNNIIICKHMCRNALFSDGHGWLDYVWQKLLVIYPPVCCQFHTTTCLFILFKPMSSTNIWLTILNNCMFNIVHGGLITYYFAHVLLLINVSAILFTPQSISYVFFGKAYCVYLFITRQTTHTELSPVTWLYSSKPSSTTWGVIVQSNILGGFSGL